MNALKYEGDISKARSYRYQADLLEFTYSDQAWHNIAAYRAKREVEIMELRQNIEKLLDLDDQLRLELWNILQLQCTPHQYQVVCMLAQGKNQADIAEELNVNQSSIHKCLKGNVNYKGDKQYHGGLAHKLAKLIQKSAKIHQIMSKMYQMDDQCYLPYFATFRRQFKSDLLFQQWIKENP